ncbi:MAG TPA: hypothetical protein VHV82_15380 [Sporichthyaceae bacterium]|nr:hypothetical protein [Sporichthyaceae bacterium]
MSEDAELGRDSITDRLRPVGPGRIDAGNGRVRPGAQYGKLILLSAVLVLTCWTVGVLAAFATVPWWGRG